MAITSTGLFDIQVNGFAGVDFNDAAITAEGMDHALAAMAHTGVAQCLPTLITAAEPELAERLRALDGAVAGSTLGRLMVPGYHLEGPFLNPEPGYAGCHPPDAMVSPCPALLRRMAAIPSRPVLLLTLAAERLGAESVLHAARSLGIVTAIGHSNAGRADIACAIAAGAVLSTHLGNALPRPAHKFDNPLMAQLSEDGLMASLIADGIHIPPYALKVMLRAKGADRTILVTDAIAAAAAPPGNYRFAGMDITHAPDGSARLTGTSTLAGSTLCLDQAVRNVVSWDLLAAAEAIALATTNPRRLMARAFVQHGIVLPPSTVSWTDDLRPAATIVADRHFSARR